MATVAGVDANDNLYAGIRESLLAFTKYTFPKYEISKHHRQIADKVERFFRGEIKRLIITVPPQRGKSELVSVRGPAWWLGNEPDAKIINISYSAELSEKFSRDARAVVGSDEYNRIFPGTVLSQSSKSSAYWAIEGHRGFFKAVGVGGPITGFPADYILIDDPLKNREEADSELIRKKLKEWYSSAVLTRLSPKGGVLICQTRWHEDDLAGWQILEHGDKWDVLHIPAVNEETGEVCWAERYTKEDYDFIRADVGERDWNALFQGNPVPVEGGDFKDEMFHRTVIDVGKQRFVRSWDIAVTEEAYGDFSCGVKMCLTAQSPYIEDVIRGKWNGPDLQDVIVRTALEDGKDVIVTIEGGATQKALGEFVQQDDRLKGYAVFVKPPGSRDKRVRALSLAGRAQRHGIYVRLAPWNDAFIYECKQFPFGKHDDQVDAASQAFDELIIYADEKNKSDLDPAPFSAEWLDRRKRERNRESSSIFM